VGATLKSSNELSNLSPRTLRNRKHFQVYFIFFLIIAVLLLSLWCIRFLAYGFEFSVKNNFWGLNFSIAYILSLPLVYFYWLKGKIRDSVQVFDSYICLHKNDKLIELKFSEISSVNIFWGSLFCLTFLDGKKVYFSSDLERVEYIWEKVYEKRPDLILKEQFSEFLVKLVKTDHHEKRKEWFFKHRYLDVFSWIILPLAFLSLSYLFQSKEILIHQPFLYFFRLLMYALLTMLIISLSYTLLLKKFIFDKKFDAYLKDHENIEKDDKIRDLEFENLVIKKSKLLQILITSFVFVLIVKNDVNFISLSKSKMDLSFLNLPSGKTMVVDNRYNCFACKYSLNEGDIILHSGGVIGQVFAKEGEPIGEILEDTKGRTIASVSAQEVPKGYVAIKSTNGKGLIFIKIVDIIGKIEK